MKTKIEEITAIEEGLARLLVEDGDFRVLEREFGQFCPFEALGMVRSEIRHGNFLAYLLNPDRPHGFHTKVLRAFLMSVAKNASLGGTNSRLKPLDVHLLEIEEADVRREWRNIDLLVVLHSAKIVILIELKIDSIQGGDQLERYRKIAQSEWPAAGGWRHINVFLTKYEEAPLDRDYWQPLRIFDLAKDLEGVANGHSDGPAAETFRAYLRMLRRHHLEDERLEEIARKIWAHHSEALSFLADRRPDAVGNLFDTIKDRKSEIETAINAAGIAVVPDADHRANARFAFKNWDDLPQFRTSTWTESKRLILLELKRESQKFNAYLYLGPGDEISRAKYLELLDKKRMHRPNARPGKDWMCLAKSEIFTARHDDEIDFDVSVDMIKKSLQNFAKKIFDHFDPILNSLRTAVEPTI
ncbi:PD-(D/E)XK nuclease family protein [Mesorhizobium sp. ORM8.1]